MWAAHEIKELVSTIFVGSFALLFLFFLINWNNNSYEYYKVEEYLRAKSCYTVTDNYNNAPRVTAYCGDSNDR